MSFAPWRSGVQESALDTNDESSCSTSTPNRLASLKTKGKELLGGIELKCQKFDFDGSEQVATAAGAGMLKADNSKIAEPDEEVGRFSLRRPCFAVVEGFEKLDYFFDKHKIVADSKSNGILIDYFPIIDGEYGKQVSVTTSHVEADLVERKNGQMELSTLYASGGVIYEEEGKEFVGSELFYDHNTSEMLVKGDEYNQCFLNGVRVDGIEYNLKTGKLKKAKLTGPSILQRR